MAVTFVGQAYLLASPKTALALPTSILSKVHIQRHKCNSEKRERARERKVVRKRERERESKPQRQKKKSLQ